MSPRQYLEQIERTLDALTRRQEITRILDELEFLYDALEPEYRKRAGMLIDRLNAKLRRVE